MFSGAFGRNKKGHRPKVIKETTDFSDKILRRNVAVNILAIKLLTIIKHENQRIHVKHEGKKFLNKSVTDRSSLRRCSVKKVFLKILQNSQENNCASLYFNKVATPSLLEHLWWLLLPIVTVQSCFA